MNYRIVILHPFTPKAAGVIESAVPVYHSQPHAKALMQYAEQTGNHCSMDYFTQKWFAYTKSNGILNWNFYPVRIQLNGNHLKWLKQKSEACLKQYQTHTPDVSIINMSAHVGLFSYKLSRIIRKHHKKYIAMLGGQHYSDSTWLTEYYQHAHHIIVHTRRQKIELEKMKLFEGKKVMVMPLGVDCNVFTPVAKEQSDKGPKLLFIGRISRNKQVHLCIDVLAELATKGFPDASLVIIGPVSDEAYQKELEEKIKRLDLEKQVTFHKQMAHDDLIPYYQQSDLFLFPSRSESFGMVMIESMACGTPVAALLGSGGPEEVIESSVDGLLASSDQYIEAVYDLIKNQDLLEQMQINARKKVTDQYSIDNSYKALTKSINMALNNE